MTDAESHILDRVFRRGSRTFYFASRLFPKQVRSEVAALYALVRIADDCVDELRADPRRLDALEASCASGYLSGLSEEDRAIVAAFRELSGRHAFDPAWLTAFFSSMRADLTPRTYATLDDTLAYVHGSAEVIGLMMAKVMGAPREAHPQAALLGRAFQYINMIRDIGADQSLGRTYIPRDHYEAAGLASLSEASARANPEAFRSLVRTELATYRAWQHGAAPAISALPLTCRPAVHAAASGYLRTADALAADPFIVYREVYKPSRLTLAWDALTQTIAP